LENPSSTSLVITGVVMEARVGAWEQDDPCRQLNPEFSENGQSLLELPNEPWKLLHLDLRSLDSCSLHVKSSADCSGATALKPLLFVLLLAPTEPTACKNIFFTGVQLCCCCCRTLTIPSSCIRLLSTAIVLGLLAAAIPEANVHSIVNKISHFFSDCPQSAVCVSLLLPLKANAMFTQPNCTSAALLSFIIS
jgi:hypothetical protein